MAVPLVTTTITVSRPAAGGDPYEDATAAPVATGVRAHISAPSGNEQRTGGSEERVDAVLLCDPVDGFDHYCRIVDDNTDEVWDVAWVRPRRGLGLDHVKAGLLAVAGGSSG